MLPIASPLSQSCNGVTEMKPLHSVSFQRDGVPWSTAVCKGLDPLLLIGKGVRCQIHTRFSDLELDPTKTFKTKIPTKVVVIKFKDLFALRFARSLELYFRAHPELSQYQWS